MKLFTYQRAKSVDDAIASQGTYLAGGTSLVDLMKIEVLNADRLVDVNRLDLRKIEASAQGLKLGALATNTEVANHGDVKQRWPGISLALLSGASPQLRNVATVGGNLLQRTRCVYFQDVTTPCNKREPGSGCSARDGHHRDLAILGASGACVATHPSDMAVAMAALDAVVRTQGPGGERTIPLTELHRLPGDEPDRDTVLEHGELITSVDLPPLALAANSRYRKVRDRASYAFALVSVAAALEVAGGTVRDVRLALGGVAHRPWRARTAEQALRGAPADEATFRTAAEAELADARPLRDNAFKLSLARNTIVRMLMDLAEGRQ
jgi:xanthine dehydrogenase YagS FAD-binding subunit